MILSLKCPMFEVVKFKMCPNNVIHAIIMLGPKSETRLGLLQQNIM